MDQLTPYLTSLDQLLEQSRSENNKDYFHPRRKNLGTLSLVLLREAIAPVVFRNAEQEITDIEFNDDTYIRAVPNKFKYPERARGLQVLRAMAAGGRWPQNKTVVPKGGKPSDAFDLNTLVFGDSAVHDSRVLPVRAAVNYSDGLSLRDKYLCVEESFHNRAAEDGSLFDADSKKNSDNLFTRHFIRPGTLMVQVLSTRGRVLPPIGLKHLLLSVGLAGSYGGQTAITGTNIRTRFVGAYADPFEPAIASPYELLKGLRDAASDDPIAMVEQLHSLSSPAYELAIPGAEVETWVAQVIADFNQSDSPLQQQYDEAKPAVARLFDEWFGK